jgi:zinc/manganese transport system substrate-binding protein
MGSHLGYRRLRLLLLAGVVAATLATSLAACSSGSSTSAGGRLQVVATENFWGSIAAQLGGNRVAVKSIITNPDTDPHSYEPTPADGRTVASAKYVIYNGIGYDPWAQKVLSANPASGRMTLSVGDLVGIKPGGNPHRWYSPTDVQRVIDRITADYKRLSPSSASYFDQQRSTFVSTGLSQYHALINEIKTKYAGTPVGASESIFTPLADALGLNLITPQTFLAAISEGGDPTAADKATIDTQIKAKQIKVYVYNSQNSTPDIQTQVNQVKAEGIPVTTITETLTPPNLSFEAWQVRQLQGIEAALVQATGR